ncbi:MAG: FecR domain-containing protein [Bacteroides sp.]|nr:FecR domain-containing protein [Bacteroides sp.]
MKNISRFIQYFARQLPPQEEEELMQWVDASEENKNTFLKYWHMYDAIHLLHDLPALPSVNRRQLYINTFLKYAAIALIVFTLGCFTTYLYVDTTATPAWQEITVPPGQRISLALTDGSAVWLNSQTTLRYNPSFSGKIRHMILDGEAYFEVKKDKKKPFVVETPQGKIEVLGTSFNVEAYSSSNSFITSLIEGSLQITSGEESMLLKPGQMVVIEGEAEPVLKKITDFEEYSWREGLICFTDASFEEIMKKFEKHYGYEIHIRNERVKEYHYSGKFRLSDGISYALQVLKEDVDFTYERNEQQSILTIKE